MAHKIIVLADLGELKAYRLSRDLTQPLPALELVADMEFTETHGKFIDKYTDAAGRFPVYGHEGPMAIGEQHDLELERERRMIKILAETIDELITREQPDYWSFAAGKEINERVLEELDPLVKARLVRNLPLDLVKAEKAELLQRF